MASPDRPAPIDAVTDARRPYPRLTEAQQDAVCREVVLYLDLLQRYRRGEPPQLVPQGQQLELFAEASPC
jgi:hypothetical protein